MIYFVRSYIANFDARLGKYFKALDEAGLAYRFLGWNKDGRPLPDDARCRYFAVKARLGAGWSNVFALLRWNLYVFWQLILARRGLRVVHAVDLDSALASWLFCRMFGKKLVFDIYDNYAAVRNIRGPVKALLDGIERYLGRSADLTLIVSEDRYLQHGLSAKQTNLMVLENVPFVEVTTSLHHEARRPWKIGYFGVLEPRHRGLEDMLTACQGRSDVELHIAGYGGLADVFAHAAERSGNIFFYGPASSARGLSLMSGMDIIAGLYYLSVPNHAFAAPNKYYEHLMLGRAMVTTQGTPPGNNVALHATGWALPDGRQAIIEWLEQLSAEQIGAAGIRARALWDRAYASYYQDQYCGAYIDRVRVLLDAEACHAAS